jgi:hypothetical protein
MNPNPTQWLAVLCFSAALLNALAAPLVAKLSPKFENHKVILHLLHHFSEIEVIFGVWALIYWLLLTFVMGATTAMRWFEARNFSEAIFIVAILIVASTAPILNFARQGIYSFANRLPFSRPLAQYFSILWIGPLFGSLITEPAAMTVCALLLHEEVLPKNASQKLLYSTLAVLFVNISVGGLLTNFAAPPVLMVASHWAWDTPFMFMNFGWKAILAVVLNAGVFSFLNRNELNETIPNLAVTSRKTPLVLTTINLTFLVLTILFAHHIALLLVTFLIFVDYFVLTKAYQGEIRPKNAILVGVFLAGLVILTAEQGFWLRPILIHLQDFVLYGSAMGLTAITDNAAITSLAAQVTGLAEPARFAILAGAVAGGGLTLIANAPNPAGFSILKNRFNGILNAGTLLKWAIIPTLIAGGMLWIHA